MSSKILLNFNSRLRCSFSIFHQKHSGVCSQSLVKNHIPTISKLQSFQVLCAVTLTAQSAEELGIVTEAGSDFMKHALNPQNI